MELQALVVLVLIVHLLVKLPQSEVEAEVQVIMSEVEMEVPVVEELVEVIRVLEEQEQQVKV